MEFDIPHMVATALIVLAATWGLDQVKSFEDMPKGRKTLIRFGGIFVAILILNLVWPYGSGA